MSVRKSTRTEEKTVVEKEDFVLVLPEELSPKAKWSIDMPKGYRAEIYEEPIRVNLHGQPLVEAIDGYKIVVIKPTGPIWRTNEHYGIGGGYFDGTTWSCDSVLSVNLCLTQISNRLMPKKVTRKIVEEDDED